MTRDIRNLFDHVVLTDDILECVSEADNARFSTLRHLLLSELTLARNLQRYIVETWLPTQQTECDALTVVVATQDCTDRFGKFCKYCADQAISDEAFHELLAITQDIYSEIFVISNGDLMVAKGAGRPRESGYSEDFIGPTGYIQF